MPATLNESIDAIDTVLARRDGFTNAARDFIVNHDCIYRIDQKKQRRKNRTKGVKTNEATECAGDHRGAGEDLR